MFRKERLVAVNEGEKLTYDKIATSGKTLLFDSPRALKKINLINLILVKIRNAHGIVLAVTSFEIAGSWPKSACNP